MLDDKNLSKQALLSTFLDNEASRQEQGRLTKILAEDRSLRETLLRYQQISQVIRTQHSRSPIDASPIAQKLQTQLDDEPIIFAPAIHKSTDLKPILLGGALAAAVALVALVLAPQLLAPQQDALEVVTETKPQRWDTLQPEVRQQLGRYLVEHHEFAGQVSVVKQPNAHINFVSSKHAD